MRNMEWDGLSERPRTCHTTNTACVITFSVVKLDLRIRRHDRPLETEVLLHRAKKVTNKIAFWASLISHNCNFCGDDPNTNTILLTITTTST